jgi:hypothetical protein
MAWSRYGQNARRPGQWHSERRRVGLVVAVVMRAGLEETQLPCRKIKRAQSPLVQKDPCGGSNAPHDRHCTDRSGSQRHTELPLVRLHKVNVVDDPLKGERQRGGRQRGLIGGWKGFTGF